MSHKSNRIENFWQELKRRKVVHVITVYAAVSFIILQLVDIVAQPLRLPAWTTALIIVLLCVGLIIAILLSWVYDKTPAGVKKTKPLSAIKHSDQTTSTTSSGWKISTYASGVLIIGLVAFNFINRRSLNADLSKLEKTIAVLPFRNDSRDTSNTYFINGLMEEIVFNLQKIGAFSRVLSRNSVEQYRNNTSKSTTEIAKELGVNYIVEGSGQKYGNSYRLRVQLIAGKNERHLWTDSYEKEIKETKDIYNTQSEVAKSIASALKIAITPEEKQRIEKTPTASLTANDFYQRGKEEDRKFSLTNLFSFSGFPTNPSNLQAIERAKKMYNTALKYDSTFALAYVGLASVYLNKNYYKEYFSGNFLDSVLILANEALSFDDQLPDAYYIRGIYYSLKGDNKQALENFDKALKINPNEWNSYYGIGNLYLNDDNLKAIENLKKAASLNHSSEFPGILRLISTALIESGCIEQAKRYNLEALKLDGDSIQYFYYLEIFEAFLGNPENAIEFLKKAYVKDSTNQMILVDLGFNYEFTKQSKESLKYYKKYVESRKTLGQNDLNNSHRIGYSYWINGYNKEAEYYFDKQIEYCNGQIKFGLPPASHLYYTYYDLAAVYAFTGNKIKAYENLKIYNKKQKTALWEVVCVKTDPLFNSIRNEPEFQKIAKDVEAKYQAEHERVRKWLEETGQL